MDRQNGGYCLEFNNHHLLDEEIQAIAGVNSESVINNWQFQLRNYVYPALLQLEL